MSGRVVPDGKHLALAGTPFRVKGVTYGGFASRSDGHRFPERARIHTDFAMIAAAGMNAVRIYDPPPAEMLDIAAESGLRLIVGVEYRDWRAESDIGRKSRRRILDAGRTAIEEAMAVCAGRPEVLAMAVGNEIPVDLVRLHGIESVTDVLSQLIAEVHTIDGDMLATYVNFPTTEFLDPRGQDLVCFNVFLEDAPSFRRYVRHLQVVSGSRPLLVTELGLAAEIHGEQAQATLLKAQLRVLDEEGTAGGTVYAWTDEWAVDDTPVMGWGFGITDGARRPKAALAVAADWSNRRIVDLQRHWPAVSVVVCAYNEERTLEECLRSLEECTYPNLEVIVCDDGSTDGTAQIAKQFPFKVLDLPHGGLSRARNAGLEAARGEIVAYLDADAACHREWPFHVVMSLESVVVATGGPNLPVPNVGTVERAVGLSPGSPTEVLLTDDRAEHIAGCNMAFRKGALRAIGGFDVAYTSAGDDVDVCWKIIDGGSEVAFSPAAQVRHHRRATIKGYLSQQRGYGRAERMLSGPHRARFNRLGQASWQGAIYGGSSILPSIFRPVVYHGQQGRAAYQPVSQHRSSLIAGWAGALLPFTLPAALAGVVLAALSPLWLLLSAAMVLLVALYAVAIASALPLRPDEPHPVQLRAVVGVLHVLQPFARMWGRLTSRPLPSADHPNDWAGNRASWLERLETNLRSAGLVVKPGRFPDRHDLQASAGPLVATRLTVAVAWDWEPRWRASYVARPMAVAVIAVGLAIALVEPWYGIAILAVASFWALADIGRLRRKVASVMRSTTAGARFGTSTPKGQAPGSDVGRGHTSVAQDV